MAFGNSNDIDIRVKVDAAGAISVFDKLGNEIENIKVESEKAGKAQDESFNQAEKSAGKLGKALGTIVAGYLSIKGINAFGGLIAKGSDLLDVASGLEQLAAKAGAVSDVLINDLDKALAGTFSQSELMRRSVELLQAKIDPSKFDELALAARGLADQAGKNTKEAFDDFTESLIKGNDRQLKNYGIIIDNKKAYEEYAKSLGFAGEQIEQVSGVLTENQQIEAVRAAILEKVTAAAGELGEVQIDAGDSLNILTASVQNQIDKITESIAKNTELQTSIQNLATTISTTDFSPLITALSKLLTLFSALADGALNFNTNLGMVLKGIDYYGDRLTLSANVADDKWRRILGQEQLDKSTQELKQKVQENANATAQFVKAWDNWAKAEDAAVKKTKEHGKEIEDTRKNLKKYLDSLGEQGKQTKEVNPELKKMTDGLKSISNQIKSMLGLDGVPQLETALRDIFKVLLDGDSTTKVTTQELFVLQKQVEELGRAFIIAGGDASKFQQALSNVKGDGNFENIQTGESANSKKDSNGSDGTIFNDFLQDALGDLKLDASALSGLADSIEQTLADSIGKALTAAIEGAFNSEDWERLLRDLGADLGESIGTMIAGPIGGAIGKIIGDQLVKGIISIFDSSDAGHEARKSVDKFFADLFNKDRLQVIINGQIKSITDLVFDPSGGKGESFEDGSFDDLFQSLPEAAQGAFAAVGLAFEQLLAEMGIDTEAIMGQLGAIIVNNIGGSLNNLQLFIEATGKSFEELGEAIKKAFLDGKISALEAATAILNLRQIMEKGIPGAAGAIKEAFENIEASVGKGGAALVDAIADIAIEAQELGLNSLPALADALVKQFGLSAVAVEQLMQAAAAAGINSLAELANASEETLLAIAANLEAIKQGLAPVFTGDALTTKAPTVSAPRSSGGSSRADQAKREREQQASELAKLIQGSRQYETILTDLENATISNGEAQKLLSQLYRAAKDALKDYNALQEKFTKQIEAGKTPSAELVKQLNKAKEALDALTGSINSNNQINAAFANFAQMYQGNFDLIQLAASQTGKTLEDFKRKTEEQFLSGALSVKEALQQIEDATGGISGKRGAVGDVLNQLISGGTQGGLFSINALRGLAKESKEIGGTILTSLEEQLIGQGVSSDIVKKLFVALTNEGIDSLDELANVSTETGIRILSGLEDISFPFQETNNEIARLNQELAKIPSSKDITINFKANFDDRTRSILERIGFDTGYGGANDSPGIKKDKKKKGKK